MKRNFYVFFSLQDFSNLFWSKIPRRFLFSFAFSIGWDRTSFPDNVLEEYNNIQGSFVAYKISTRQRNLW